MTERGDNETLERGVRALRERPTALDGAHRARLWAGVDAARAPTSWWRLLPIAAAGLVAAGAAGLWIVGDPAPPRTVVASDRGAVSPIAFDSAARYALQPRPILRAGRAVLTTVAAEPTALATPHLTIQLLTGRATLEVDEATTLVEIEWGRAEVTALGEVRRVSAGERVAITARGFADVRSGPPGSGEPDSDDGAPTRDEVAKLARDAAPSISTQIAERSAESEGAPSDRAAPRRRAARARETTTKRTATRPPPSDATHRTMDAPTTDATPGAMAAPTTDATHRAMATPTTDATHRAMDAPTTDAAPRAMDPPAPKTTRRAASAETTTPRPANDDRAEVEAARSLVRRDAPRAEAMAEAVLERKPAPQVEASALMVLADIRRRAGDLAEAATIYARVAKLDGGAQFHEEALLRRAELLARTNARRDALAVLVESERRADFVALRPERCALTMRLLLEIDGPAAAARHAACDGVQGAAMARARYEVAEALAATDRPAAIDILNGILRGRSSAAIAKRARTLRDRLEDD